MFVSDEDIIRGCRQGKAQAQKALYEKYSRRMLAVCLRYIPDRMQAEDVFQDAFVKVFEALNQYRDGSLEGWMRRIFVHFSINYYNRRYKKQLAQSLDITEAIVPTPWPSALDSLSVDEIMALVNKLPEGCRVVFLLHAIEGYEHAEIAQSLGISEGTSKSQLHRARALLKAQMVSPLAKT